MVEPLVWAVSHLTDHQWQSLSSFSSGTVVLYLPNLCCVMSGFDSSVAGVAEAITPSLRHKALSPHPFVTPQAAWQRQGAGYTL